MTAPTVEEEGWIEWHGGEQPVAGDVRVECRFRGGMREVDDADRWHWLHSGDGQDTSDIIAYRVVSAPLGEPGGEGDQGSSLRDTHRAPEGDVLGLHEKDSLGYPATPWGKVETARRVLANIARPQKNDGTAVVYHVSDDVPEDIAVALSYVTAAIEAATTEITGSAVGIGPLADEPKNTPAPTEKGDGVETLLRRALANVEGVPGKAHYAKLDAAENDIRRAIAMIAATQQATGAAPVSLPAREEVARLIHFHTRIDVGDYGLSASLDGADEAANAILSLIKGDGR